MQRVTGNTLKAAFIERFGGPDVLQYGDLPDPAAAPGEVVVAVAAASVNGADWKVRAGQYADAKFPLVLGRDFSGTVATTGAGVDDLKIGDAVFGVLEAGREGAYAENSPSRPRSLPGNPTRCRTSTPPLWRSPGLPPSPPSRRR
jgi:NADPH:quinone reductase-like Zn-dependent oxidoreductase